MKTFLIGMAFAVGCLWLAFGIALVIRAVQSWRDQQGENNG